MPSETPIFRSSPSNGYNPSTEPQKALKSPCFAGALIGHLHPTRARLAPDSLPFRPKSPVFSKNLDCVSYPPRDFRDQFPDFARLSCIEKGLSKNMARILRGVKGSSASSAGGGGVFFLSSLPRGPFLCSFRPAVSLPARTGKGRQAVGLPSLQFFDHGRF
jgi:hypothetical protein